MIASGRRPSATVIRSSYNDETWNISGKSHVDTDALSAQNRAGSHYHVDDPAFKYAYTNNNVDVNALRGMSEPVRANGVARSDASMGIAPPVVLPMDGSNALRSRELLMSVWDEGCNEALGAATRELDPSMSYVDRMGRKVNVYTSTLPSAQKDHGTQHGEEQLRRHMGLNASTLSVHKKEVSNDDVPLLRDAPGDDSIQRGTRARREELDGDQASANRTHNIEAEVDWQRPAYMDGYNLRAPNETRAPRCGRTQRTRYERNPELGASRLSQNFKGERFHGVVRTPRRTAPLTDTPPVDGFNSHSTVFASARHAPIVLAEATVRAMPSSEGIRGIALYSEGAPLPRVHDHGRGVTQRPEHALTQTEDLSAHSAVAPLQRRQQGQSTPSIDSRREETREAPPMALSATLRRAPNSRVSVSRDDVRDVSQHTLGNANELLVRAMASKGTIELGTRDGFVQPDAVAQTGVVHVKAPQRATPTVWNSDSVVQSRALVGVQEDLGARQHGQVTLHEGDDADRRRWVEGKNEQSITESRRRDAIATVGESDDTERTDARPHAASASFPQPHWRHDAHRTSQSVELHRDEFGDMSAAMALMALPLKREEEVVLNQDAFRVDRTGKDVTSAQVPADRPRDAGFDVIQPAGGQVETDRTLLYDTLSLEPPSVVEGMRIELPDNPARTASSGELAAAALSTLAVPQITTGHRAAVAMDRPRERGQGLDEAPALPMRAAYPNQPSLLPTLSPDALIVLD